jgi:hypothetical protein
MPLNASGPLSLGGSTVGQSVNLELGKSATALISMNDTDLRSLFGVASGQISMSQGYGKSSYDVNATRGYFGGGETGPSAATRTNSIKGFQFSNETSLVVSATLTRATSYNAGVNNPTNGYFAGGNIPSPAGSPSTNTIDGFLFSNETTFNPGISLVQSRASLSSLNSTTKGYFFSGQTPNPVGAPFTRSQIDGILFSNETAIDPAAAADAQFGSTGVNSQTRGYIAGGAPPGFGPLTTKIDGFLFSNETYATISATLAQARFKPGPVNSLTRGYFGGGGPGPGIGQIDGIQFSNETAIDPAAALAQARNVGDGTNSSTRGYFVGGVNPADDDIYRSEIDGIQFSDETAINPAAVLSTNLSDFAAVQNSNN